MVYLGCAVGLSPGFNRMKHSPVHTENNHHKLYHTIDIHDTNLTPDKSYVNRFGLIFVPRAQVIVAARPLVSAWRDDSRFGVADPLWIVWSINPGAALDDGIGVYS